VHIVANSLPDYLSCMGGQCPFKAEKSLNLAMELRLNEAESATYL